MLQSACSCIFSGLVSSPWISMSTSESVSLSASESSDLVAACAIIFAVLCLVQPRDSVEDGSSQIQTRGGISLLLLTGIEGSPSSDSSVILITVLWGVLGAKELGLGLGDILKYLVNSVWPSIQQQWWNWDQWDLFTITGPVLYAFLLAGRC